MDRIQELYERVDYEARRIIGETKATRPQVEAAEELLFRLNRARRKWTLEEIPKPEQALNDLTKDLDRLMKYVDEDPPSDDVRDRLHNMSEDANKLLEEVRSS